MDSESELPSVPFTEALLAVLARPRPTNIWHLRSIMVSGGLQPSDDLWKTLGAFHEFLSTLMASGAARKYSEFAAQLDMAAIGGVALQNLVHQRDSEAWLPRLLLAVGSEGLMVTAARQYVRAWDEEMQASYRTAAWSLSDAFWLLSTALQPRLSIGKRWAMIDKLVDPLRNEAESGLFKAGLAVRLYQILLLAQLKQTGWFKGPGPIPGSRRPNG
ncbi:MAG: hypothetical protein R3300_04405 [Candidatus Promineifilaceae bacterium]|nr:hypothetical protein [Candidatus Promineifilaceae bacterium]